MDEPDTSNQLRVAMISVHTSPLAALGGKDAGGMNVYVRELALELGRTGVAVDIFTRRSEPTSPEIRELAPRVRLVQVTAGPAEPLAKNVLFDLLPDFAEWMVLFGVREGVRYDLIHAHYWLSGWVAHLLRRFWECPFVVMFHTMARMKNSVSPAPLHETPLREQTETTLVKVADSIVAGSPEEHASLIDICPSCVAKVCTIPPGVDLKLFAVTDYDESRAALGWAETDRVALFVGRIDPIKGLDTLVNAIPLVSNPRARFVFVGGELDDRGEAIGPLREIVEAIKVLGVGDRCLFLGSLPQDELPTYYSGADIVVVPSRYESFGLVAVEAMATGTPVVASRVGGLAYTIEDGVTGVLVKQGDVTELANAIDDLLTDDVGREEMYERCVATASRFSWSSVVGQIDHMYRRLVAGHRADLCCDEEIYA